MKIASAHVYPVKGMRGCAVERAGVKARGLEGDRRWLVVDEDGAFLTQRSAPRLARFQPVLGPEGLTISHEDEDGAFVPVPSGAARREVAIWSVKVDAAAAPGADDWLSERLGRPVGLVYMDARALRLKESVWTTSPVPVSFADAFPVLVTTTGSLAALNDDIERHGGDPVPMARFRPNIVIHCDEPWAEDDWTQLAIGGVVLDLVKPSDRCIVTTTDQMTGARMGKEPLAALARIRRSADPRIDGVLFGVNAVPTKFGAFKVGDEVAIVRT